MKALILSADNFEDSELLVPYYRMKEAGVEVAVASLNRDEVKPDDYAVLILPGGAAPAILRKEPKALEIARIFCGKQTGCRHLPQAADLNQRRPFTGATRHLLPLCGR